MDSSGLTHSLSRAVVLIGVLCAGAASALAQASGAPELFEPNTPVAAQQPDSAVVRDRTVVRSRPVRLNAELLSAAADAVSGSGAYGQSIALNLFEDVVFVADADRIERTARGVNWVGRLRGVAASQVVIATNGAVVSGNITLPSARYHVRFAGNGLHEVQRIDDSLFPDDEASVPVPYLGAAGEAAALADVSAQADDGSLIDVMIVYTATTRAAAGGTAAMQSLMDLAIAETNQSYLNSGVSQRLRLVHTEEVAYNESGHANPLNDALNCITSTNDGCLDNVHALRDTHGADLVSFWVEDGGTYCGLGWMMATVSPAFAPYGFSAVARSCATGYYSFGHELGHNMGARHDGYVDTASTPYAYAHGYAYPAGHWRTIMAYNNACTAIGTNCTRLQYWANPSVSYGGAAMGDAVNADDHRALNNTALTVANFRASAVAPACNYGLSASGQTIGAAAASGSVAVSAANGCAWTAVSDAAWLSVVSGASGSGNGSVGWSAAANAGQSARSATITIAGQAYTVTQGFEDGFPSGAALPSNWVQPPGSSAPWAVSSTASYGGASSVRSGTIGNGQQSALQVSGRFKAGTISFVCKVDSESNYDFLNFYIDGVLRGSWSGNVPWTSANYAVAAGTHSFKWEYAKNASTAVGADAAWIDNVALPPPDNMAAFGALLFLLLE